MVGVVDFGGEEDVLSWDRAVADAGADAVLAALGRRDRKGAHDTFDDAGYAALLARLAASRTGADPLVYAPEFRREIEEPVAGAIAVPAEVPLVVTEGNYLLLQDPPWSGVRALLDEAWYLAPPEPTRLQRLLDRHVEFGKSPEQARAWVQRVDEPNAQRIAATMSRSDLVVPF